MFEEVSEVIVGFRSIWYLGRTMHVNERLRHLMAAKTKSRGALRIEIHLHAETITVVGRPIVATLYRVRFG
jgi:hypothetical protein